MKRRQISGCDHITVACQYGFGTFDDETPFIELATGNPKSETGSISQIIRIPKQELLMLLREMYSEGLLKFADLEDLVSTMESNVR